MIDPGLVESGNGPQPIKQFSQDEQRESKPSCIAAGLRIIKKATR